MTPPDAGRLARAAALATHEFDGVLRKATGVPYVTHLYAVAALVGEHGGDEDQMIAALLHDWLEDVDGASVERLEVEFGPRVARIVLACSDTTVRPKPPWRERKERHLAHLRVQEPDVKLIVAADKLHNARCLLRDVRSNGDDAFRPFNASKEDTLWYYDAATGAIAHEYAHPIVDDLRRTVDRLLAF
jgi:(p)ppGpp synthase/HD superfamily hydrolase